MKHTENRLFHVGIVKLAALTNARNEQCACSAVFKQTHISTVGLSIQIQSATNGSGLQTFPVRQNRY